MRDIKKQQKQGRKKQKTGEKNFPQLSITPLVLIFASFLCLDLQPSPAITITPKVTLTQPTILNPGMMGAEVQVLQVQLKALGYYNDLIDGQYGLSTIKAVSQFQKSQNAKRKDGIADLTTQANLKRALSSQTKCTTTPAPVTAPTPQVNINSPSSKLSSIGWLLLGLGTLVNAFAVFYVLRKLRKIKYSASIDPDIKLLSSSDPHDQKLLNPSYQTQPRFFLKPAQISVASTPTELLPAEKNAVFSKPKISIFDELIKDLRVNDPTQKRKAIWSLGQQGDSRAIKPLVDLMIDADSQQHSLILSALAEIGTRTLKPMNRALAISMQNESSQVRKNAIRDLVRIYDMMGQMSQVLRHALEDPDPEVQATAKYAFTKMNRVSKIPEQQILTDMNGEESSW
jgi:peptidoglycan hydrolase-like protein with peptidoglycan-binding domain